MRVEEQLVGALGTFGEAFLFHVDLVASHSSRAIPILQSIHNDHLEEAPKMNSSFPAIDLLMSLDAKYREKATAGKLKLIAPKKLNPEQKAQLPIMNVQRNGWRFTVLFSNTQKVHELGKTQAVVSEVVHNNQASLHPFLEGE